MSPGESFVKTIIREVVHECIVRGGTFFRHWVDSKLFMEAAMTTYSPSFDTIKMQLYFDLSYTSKPALQSIFPSNELGPFMVLSKGEKEQQLSELTMTVTGIRLFNKSTKKEQEMEITELIPAILCEALLVTSKDIENELGVSQRLAWNYTALLEKCNISQLEEYDVSLIQLTQALYNVRQHELFLQILLADSHSCAKRIEILKKDICSQINLLNTSVQPKTAVPTSKVFPLFKALSKLWSELQDEAELLNIFHNIAFKLQFFRTTEDKIFSKDILNNLLEGIEVKTDKQRLNEQSSERIDPRHLKQYEWLHPEPTKNITDLPLQYNGFCCYTLVNKDGLILPGNPYIGVLKHKEKLFVFNSKEAACKFAQNPDYFIALVEEKAKSLPELMKLLKLHQTPPCVQAGKTLLGGQSESFTQTDLHPLVTNFVKPYEWNEWELRRSAIKLADLQTTITHSTQTHLSHMRRENATQTWLPKEVGCQSKRDGETGVPKPQIFLAGLRGCRDGRMEKINLTRSINE
ncbi:cilia- and flagella-associated protein 206 isoform X2 [Stigmatopora argus]